MIPVTAERPHLDERIERENQQTARVIFGLMSASFITGILTTIFGLKNKSK